MFDFEIPEWDWFTGVDNKPTTRIIREAFSHDGEEWFAWRNNLTEIRGLKVTYNCPSEEL